MFLYLIFISGCSLLWFWVGIFVCFILIQQIKGKEGREKTIFIPSGIESQPWNWGFCGQKSWVFKPFWRVCVTFRCRNSDLCGVGLYLPFIHVSPGGFHCWGSLIFSFDSLELLVVLDDSLALDGHTTQGHRSHQAFHSHLCVILSVNRDCNFRTEKKDNKKEEGVLVPCFLKAKGWH